MFSSPSPAMQRELPSPIIPDDLIPKFVEIQHCESHTASCIVTHTRGGMECYHISSSLLPPPSSSSSLSLHPSPSLPQPIQATPLQRLWTCYERHWLNSPTQTTPCSSTSCTTWPGSYNTPVSPCSLVSTYAHLVWVVEVSPCIASGPT